LRDALDERHGFVDGKGLPFVVMRIRRLPRLDQLDAPAIEGECRGVNDFPCAFTDYAADVIEQCFHATECTADGWVSVTLDPDPGDERWAEVVEWVRTSYTLVAPKKLAKVVLDEDG